MNVLSVLKYATDETATRQVQRRLKWRLIGPMLVAGCHHITRITAGAFDQCGFLLR